MTIFLSVKSSSPVQAGRTAAMGYARDGVRLFASSPQHHWLVEPSYTDLSKLLTI